MLNEQLKVTQIVKNSSSSQSIVILQLLFFPTMGPCGAASQYNFMLILTTNLPLRSLSTVSRRGSRVSGQGTKTQASIRNCRVEFACRLFVHFCCYLSLPREHWDGVNSLRIRETWLKSSVFSFIACHHVTSRKVVTF